MPRITIILPVFNAAPYLDEAIQSLLIQTCKDFEIIAINDGSTDTSSQLLHHFAQSDPRIRLFERENRGLIPTLNDAISLATTEYIARMDADDLSLPTRLEKQLTHLDAHPEIAVLGTFMQSFPPPAPQQLWQFPTDPAAIACAMIFRSPLAHPTIMMRRSLFSEGGFSYDPAAKHIEDFALWLKISERHQLANLPEPLLRYRTHPNQISAQHLTHQEHAVVHLQLDLIHRRLHLLGNPTLHHQLAYNHLQPTEEFLTTATTWLLTLAHANEKHGAFPQEEFLRTLTGRYITLHRFAKQNNLPLPPIPESFTPYVHPGALD
jgi:hypothetical protein